MRLDDAGPRTWLLATTAGWSLLALGLALFGMGSRIEQLPEDPGLLRPLPPLKAPVAERLGPLAQYSEIGARPLFSTDRRPKPFSLQGNAAGDAAAPAFDFLLTSVLITPGAKVAILQPPDGSKSVRVRMGDTLESHPGWRLTTLNARSAIFEGPEGQRTLDLRVFDGQGGQGPTAIAGPSIPRPGGGDGVSPADGGTPPELVPPPRPIVERPTPTPAPSAGSAARPATPPRNTDPASSPTATDQAQMEAIRQRIQARREQLRQQQNQTQPPAQ